MIEEFKKDNLEIKVLADRTDLGVSAARMVAARIAELLHEQEFVNIIFASAPSQNEFLAALAGQSGLIWPRINAFHMDEYIGLPSDHPALFSSFLKQKLFGLVPFGTVNYINASAPDALAECRRYAQLLLNGPPDIVCMGIGENGHVAFNDPHTADLADPLLVKVVDLDLQCRQQQVNDGCFSELDEVPLLAITLTVPALMAARQAYCMVPGKNKARAVHHTLFNQISRECPASALRGHPMAVLFLDTDSSSLIKH